MSEHSPLPWRTANGGGVVIDAEGDVVYIDSADSEEIANARLIVRAVNTHDRLFAAAKEVMDLSIHIDAPRLRRAFIHLQAAIAAL